MFRKLRFQMIDDSHALGAKPNGSVNVLMVSDILKSLHKVGKHVQRVCLLLRGIPVRPTTGAFKDPLLVGMERLDDFGGAFWAAKFGLNSNPCRACQAEICNS
jgi:hypothetical protein